MSECAHVWQQQLCVACGAECPTCTSGPGRETSGLVCQRCGRDFGEINGLAIRAALIRAKSGDDPDMVYAELYANSEEDTP